MIFAFDHPPGVVGFEVVYVQAGLHEEFRAITCALGVGHFDVGACGRQLGGSLISGALVNDDFCFVVYNWPVSIAACGSADTYHSNRQNKSGILELSGDTIPECRLWLVGIWK